MNIIGKRARVCVLIVVGALAGCGAKTESSPANSSATDASNAAKTPVDAATAGIVRGTVKLNGSPPAMKQIRMNAVPSCAAQHNAPPMTEDVVTGDNGALQNVVVYLQGDFTSYAFEKPAPAQIDQKGCMYVPHVIAVMTGAPIQFLSSDSTSHNVHALPRNNRGWNESQTSKGASIEQSFAREEVAVPIKCNLHPWMRAYVAVIGNPYFQVTGRDGSFALKNIPPGSYALTAWQEHYGSKTQRITVGPKQEQAVDITFGP